MEEPEKWMGNLHTVKNNSGEDVYVQSHPKTLYTTKSAMDNDKLASYVLDITRIRRNALEFLTYQIYLNNGKNEAQARKIITGNLMPLTEVITLASNLYVHIQGQYSRIGECEENYMFRSAEGDMFGLKLRMKEVLCLACPDIPQPVIEHAIQEVFHYIGKDTISLLVRNMGNNTPCTENFLSSQPSNAFSLNSPLLVTISKNMRRINDEFLL